MEWFVALGRGGGGCSTWRTVEPSSIYRRSFAADKPVIVATEIGALEMAPRPPIETV